MTPSKDLLPNYDVYFFRGIYMTWLQRRRLCLFMQWPWIECSVSEEKVSNNLFLTFFEMDAEVAALSTQCFYLKNLSQMAVFICDNCVSSANRINMLLVVWVTEMGSTRSNWHTLTVVAFVFHLRKYCLLFSLTIVIFLRTVPHSAVGNLPSNPWRCGVWSLRTGRQLGGSGVQFSPVTACSCILCIPACVGMGTTGTWHPCPD